MKTLSAGEKLLVSAVCMGMVALSAQACWCAVDDAEERKAQRAYAGFYSTRGAFALRVVHRCTKQVVLSNRSVRLWHGGKRKGGLRRGRDGRGVGTASYGSAAEPALATCTSLDFMCDLWAVTCENHLSHLFFFYGIVYRVLRTRDNFNYYGSTL